MTRLPRSGVFPVTPTAFHDDESLDLASQVRVVDFLIDAGADAVCILANYSEQFSLTDSERDQVAACVLDRAAGRVPVIVTASHYSARIAATVPAADPLREPPMRAAGGQGPAERGRRHRKRGHAGAAGAAARPRARRAAGTGPAA